MLTHTHKPLHITAADIWHADILNNNLQNIQLTSFCTTLSLSLVMLPGFEWCSAIKKNKQANTKLFTTVVVTLTIYSINLVKLGITSGISECNSWILEVKVLLFSPKRNGFPMIVCKHLKTDLPKAARLLIDGIRFCWGISQCNFNPLP